MNELKLTRFTHDEAEARTKKKILYLDLILIRQSYDMFLFYANGKNQSLKLLIDDMKLR